MRIINKEYNISKKLNKKIVLISDIHYNSKLDIKHLNKVLDSIKNIKPNYICIVGDIIDKTYIDDEDELIIWLTKLSNICKVIVALGNHEFYINKKTEEYGLNKKLFNKISKIDNLYYLDNNNIIIDDINYIGLTQNMDTRLVKLEDKYKVDNKYNIVLCHSPKSIIGENVSDINLILSGHTHGGLVHPIFRKIIKHSGIISPDKKLFPKDVYGLIKVKDTNMIINSGIRVLSDLSGLGIFKNLFPSEIVIINL